MLAVFVDTKLQVLAELVVELLVVFGVFCDLVEQLEALFDDVLADDFENLALLEHLSRDVEREIFRIDHTLHEIEVLWDELFAVLHDEHAPHVELDVVLDLAILEEVKWSTFRNKEKCAELELALNGEVLHSEMILPIVGEGLVELAILVLADVVRVSCPDGLHLVQLLQFVVLLLDFFGLLLILILLVCLFIITHILQLSFILEREGEREGGKERGSGRDREVNRGGKVQWHQHVH